MNIYESIGAIMAECGPISKDKKNVQQGFNYRGVDDVMNTLQPLMAKYKVFVAPAVLECQREERNTKNGGALLYSICKIRYTFYAEDGSSISAVVLGEGMDSGDKASNKAMAVAFKYACFQVFCIPTEEMKDPDAESHEVAGRSASPKPSPVLCPRCGKEIKPYLANGKKYPPEYILNNYGMCKDCYLSTAAAQAKERLEHERRSDASQNAG